MKTDIRDRGIFKGLQHEFELQLKGVIEHYHQSNDLKFNSRYVTEKLKQLYDVRISERQCRIYLTRLHDLVKPCTRALIKFKNHQKRVEVSQNSIFKSTH